MARKNQDFVSHLNYSEPVQAYLATQIELDRALEHLLAKLEEAGVADNTLIALSADHYPYGLEHEYIEELSGKHVDENFELYRNAFLLYAKGMTPEVITDPSSSLDIMPTLSNLLGLEYDSRLFMGRDLFSDTPPLVIFANRSFITKQGRYNSETQSFTPVTASDNYDPEKLKPYIESVSNIIKSKFYFSGKILDYDYYSYLIK